MDEPFLRPDQFMVMFPCFAIKDERTTVKHGVGTSFAMILFTDEDLLNKFVSTTGYTGGFSRLTNMDEFLSCLGNLPDNVEYIHFDPSEGKPKLNTIDNVLMSLQRHGGKGD